MTVLGLAYGGLACWIQDLNYLVAAIPLAFGIASLIYYRRTQDPTARLRGAVFLASFIPFFLHAHRRVVLHVQLLAQREVELQVVIDRLASENPLPESLKELDREWPDALKVEYRRLGQGSYELAFRHNLFRHHVYDSRAAVWVDHG